MIHFLNGYYDQFLTVYGLNCYKIKADTLKHSL